jgi:hypothetical protein
MKRSASGEQLWKDIRVVICLPEQKDIIWRYHAQPRCGWTEEQLGAMLAGCVSRVEQLYPSIEFRLVELAPNDVKFIYAGRKANAQNRRGTAQVHAGMDETLAFYPEELRKTPCLP